MKKKKRLIKCNSCGAWIKEMLPKCPYCDSTNIKGAEAEYLEKLEEIKDNMESLSEAPMEETRKVAQKTGKMILMTLAGIGILILLGVTIYGIKQSVMPKKDYKKAVAWQLEAFEVLDELYAQENYPELVEFYSNAILEERPIENWEHYKFAAAMYRFLQVEDIWKKEAAGSVLNEEDYVELLYLLIRVDDYEKSTAYSAEEKKRMLPYIEKVRADGETRFQFSEQEWEEINTKVKDKYGNISISSVEEQVKKWMEKRGIR